MPSISFSAFRELFPTEEMAVECFIRAQYLNAITCPKCYQTQNVYHQHIRFRNGYCNNCKYEFSFFKNTIFEKSETDLRIWFYAIFLMFQERTNISPTRLKNDTGITYKTAWRIVEKINMQKNRREVNRLLNLILRVVT
jgi:hypothetical protein